MVSMTKLTVYKSNKVVEAAYKLSLNEQKIILACIAKHDPRKPLTADNVFIVTAKEFADLTGVELNNAYGLLKDVADSLFSRHVVIDNPDATNPKIKKRKTRWISSIDYYADSGALSLRFAYDMLPYLSELKDKFTKYELQNIGGMTSKYGIRLYELLSQYRSIGRREIAIDWLKNHFEIADNYSIISDFKKYVIKAATDDINKNSDLLMHEPIYQKTGRKVTHVTFDFKEKPQTKKRQTTQKEKPREQAPPISNIEYFVSTLNGLRHNADLRNKIIQTIPPEIVEQVLNRVTN